MLSLGIHGADLITPIRAGQSILAFHGVSNRPDGAASANSGVIAWHAETAREASEILVSVDSLIFDSGLIVGPDKAGNAVRYAAEQHAIRSMLSELKNLKDSGADAGKLEEYLTSLSSTTPRRTTRVEDEARDTQFHVLIMRKSLAGGLVHRRTNLDGCIDYLEKVSAMMVDLHR
jgi:hypothetical protein